MAYEDVYEVIDAQTLAGQEVLNVYFFVNKNAADTTSTAEDLATVFESVFLPNVTLIQTDNVLHTEIRVRNLFDPSDSFTLAISEAGQNLTADTMPNANALAYTLAQDSGSVRNGQKRYAGLREDAITDGIVTLAGWITTLNDLGDAIVAALQFAAVDTWFPAIIKRVLDAGNYRLPNNAGELIYGIVQEAIFNPVVSTQTSRKIGRGA